jgi:hypothetical protein
MMKKTFILLGFLILGFGVLYWLLKPPATVWAVDTDLDGLVDQVDDEDSTIWLTDTSKYHLYKYVNAMGRVDSKKTKPLCDCWEFPEVTNRKILLCQDNKNWFNFEYNLYEFREDNPGDGRFYKNKETRVATSEDDQIEQHHKKLFPEAYTSEVNPEAVVVSGYSNITYKGKVYSIKSDFLSNEGALFNTARWKFKNNTLQKRECITNTEEGRGAWNNASTNDIDVILRKFGTLKVDKKVAEEVDEKVAEEDEKPKKITDYSDYWIRLNKLPINELKGRKSEITQNKLDSKYNCPNGSKGDLARASVLTKIN